MIIEILIALGIILLSSFIGQKVLNLFSFGKHYLYSLEAMVFSVGIGLGCLIYITFIMGMSGLFYVFLFRLLFALSMLLILRRLITNRTKIRATGYKNILVKDLRIGLFDVICLFMLTVVVLYIFLESLKPEFYSDALRYHLYVPKKFIEHHKIFYVDSIPFSSMPFNTEMLYTLGLMLGKQITARLVNFIMSLVLLMSIFSFCKRYLSLRIGIVAALVFCITPIFINASITAGSDISVTLFSFLGIYSIINWIHSKRLDMLVVGAVFSGLAMGSKYNALYVIFTLVIVITVVSRRNPKEILKNISLFLLIILLITSIWWIKSYMHTGNPVFPFLNKVFKSEYWWQSHNDWFNFGTFGRQPNLVNILITPWDITFNSHLYGESGIGHIYLFFISLGLLFYMITKQRSKTISYLLLYLLLYFFIWILTVQYSRYLLPMLTVASIVASCAIFNLEETTCPARVFKSLIKSGLIMLFIFEMPMLDIDLQGKTITWRNPAAGLFKDKDEYLAKRLDDYAVAQYVNENLRGDNTILEIKAQENYYYYDCNMVRLYQYPFVRIIYEHISEDDLRGLMNHLKEKKVSHILLNIDDIGVKRALNSKESPLVRIKKEELFSHKNYRLYKVDYSNLL